MRLRAGLAATLALLALPGCFTIGTWDWAGETNETSLPYRIELAELQGERLELVVSYEDHDHPLQVVFDLTRPSEETYAERPLYAGEILAPYTAEIGYSPVSVWPIFNPQDDIPTPRSPTQPEVFWSSDELLLCLVRPEREPVFARVPSYAPSAAAPLAYVGATLVTPVTFAFDVVTFPVQVIMLIVFLEELDDLLGD